jgi:hypothetical protein
MAAVVSSRARQSELAIAEILGRDAYESLVEALRSLIASDETAPQS